MKIISKTLKGMVSFRGLGFVEVNGMHVAVCGSRVINCGVGAAIRWCDLQLMQVPQEQEMEATFYGTFFDAAVASGEVIFQSADNRQCLYLGTLEGLPLGADRSASAVFAVPPLNFTMVQVSPRSDYMVGVRTAIMDVNQDLAASYMYVNAAK